MGDPVLTHRHRAGHPIQSGGHADLVDDADGNWWAVCLGTRREPTHYRFAASHGTKEPAPAADLLVIGQAEMTTLSAETADEFCGVRFALFSEHSATGFHHVVHEPMSAAATTTESEHGGAR